MCIDLWACGHTPLRGGKNRRASFQRPFSPPRLLTSQQPCPCLSTARSTTCGSGRVTDGVRVCGRLPRNKAEFKREGWLLGQQWCALACSLQLCPLQPISLGSSSRPSSCPCGNVPLCVALGVRVRAHYSTTMGMGCRRRRLFSFFSTSSPPRRARPPKPTNSDNRRPSSTHHTTPQQAL
mgnify:CR=1 FL=1